MQPIQITLTLFNRPFKLKVMSQSEEALRSAVKSMNENIEILKWFKQNNYLKNIKTHTDTAIEYGKIKCLDWFKSIGFKIKYNYSALIDAYNYNRRVDIFSKNNFYLFYAWLKKNNYKHKNYKKMIKICKCKYIEFKTKNKYLKGYNKN